MAWYSPSRLRTFGQCRLQYRFRYLDKEKSAFTSAQAHFGTSVHKALERLYGDVMQKQIPQVGDIIDEFRTSWQGNPVPEMKFIKVDEKRNPDKAYRSYIDKGIILLDAYHAKHEPFDGDHTLRIEAKVTRTLKDGSTVFGYVDRIAEDDGRIAIIDYKTGRRQSKRDADTDLQLGIYNLCIERDYRDAEVVLRWEYVAEDKVVESTRTIQDLRDLEDLVIGLIAEIESNEDWPAKLSNLCDYCGYNPICAEYQEERGFKVARDLPTGQGDPKRSRRSGRRSRPGAPDDKTQQRSSQSTLFDH